MISKQNGVNIYQIRDVIKNLFVFAAGVYRGTSDCRVHV
jgi:hypothetical protein